MNERGLLRPLWARLANMFKLLVLESGEGNF